MSSRIQVSPSLASRKLEPDGCRTVTNLNPSPGPMLRQGSTRRTQACGRHCPKIMPVTVTRTGPARARAAGGPARRARRIPVCGIRDQPGMGPRPGASNQQAVPRAGPRRHALSEVTRHSRSLWPPRRRGGGGRAAVRAAAARPAAAADRLGKAIFCRAQLEAALAQSSSH